MAADSRIALIRHAMGSAHIFSSMVTELLERTLAESTEGELGMAQVQLLLLIARPNHKFKVTDVAQYLGVTNAAASRAIDRLVQRGLIERVTEPEDRRAVDLRTTAASRALLARFTEARDRELGRLLEGYPAEKLEEAAALMDELTERLAGLGGTGGDVSRQSVLSRGLYGDRPHGATPSRGVVPDPELAAFGGP